MGNKITIKNNKEIDLDSLNDEQIIKLFTGLKERELVLTENIIKLENKIELLQKNN